MFNAEFRLNKPVRFAEVNMSFHFYFFYKVGLYFSLESLSLKKVHSHFGNNL